MYRSDLEDEEKALMQEANEEQKQKQLKDSEQKLAEFSKSVVWGQAKAKFMRGCIFFTKFIKPVIILIFVLIYWGSGLVRSAQTE